jgi:hypothetical protein
MAITDGSVYYILTACQTRSGSTSAITDRDGSIVIWYYMLAHSIYCIITERQLG